TLRTVAPQLFSPALPWLAVGAISAAGGALFALAQRNLKRLLAFSTVTDMGLMIVALVIGGAWGMEGAILGAAAHSIAKALLFASVSGPEAEGAAMVNVATYGRAIALFWWGSEIPAPCERRYSRVALGASIVLLTLAALIAES